MIRTNVQRLGEQITGPFNVGVTAFPQGQPGSAGAAFGAGYLRSDRCGCGRPDLAWRPLRRVVYTAWMSQPCRSSCMNGTFTSYAAVLMMPMGRVGSG